MFRLDALYWFAPHTDKILSDYSRFVIDLTKILHFCDDTLCQRPNVAVLQGLQNIPRIGLSRIELKKRPPALWSMLNLEFCRGTNADLIFQQQTQQRLSNPD